ncbi:hypothetical protein CHS0354_006514 [Potamilus streckersoni]|uniref:Glutathione peroxidase n=1 Tax=Potamilus streckersoni TaxID=2493646 RepID=A0AAE0WAY9_9BIVA|nr:hypothetical protein CHS0354_006514 [Potamilus streckersoni]
MLTLWDFYNVDLVGFYNVDLEGFYNVDLSECPPAWDRVVQPILYEPIYTSDVRWNFEKFLIGRDGRPVYRYASTIDPRTSQMLDADIAVEIKKTLHDHRNNVVHIVG